MGAREGAITSALPSPAWTQSPEGASVVLSWRLAYEGG